MYKIVICFNLKALEFHLLQTKTKIDLNWTKSGSFECGLIHFMFHTAVAHAGISSHILQVSRGMGTISTIEINQMKRKG